MAASSTNEQTPLAVGETYQAPLQGADNPNRVMGWYVVDLKPGHDIEQHSAVVGTDMNKYIKNVLRSIYPDRDVYHAVDINDDLLDAIRKDTGVQVVYCDANGIEEE